MSCKDENKYENNKDSNEINYCTDFICTYHLHNLDDQDDMYKCQMAQAFMIENGWYDESVNETIKKIFDEFMSESNQNYIENKGQMEKLFEKMEYNLFPKNYCDNIKSNTKIDKQLFLFKYLFVFDYFFKTHELICNFLNTDNSKNNKLISGKIIDQLINLFSISK